MLNQCINSVAVADNVALINYSRKYNFIFSLSDQKGGCQNISYDMGDMKEILLPEIYTLNATQCSNVLVYKEQWLKLEKDCERWYFVTFA